MRVLRLPSFLLLLCFAPACSTIDARSRDGGARPYAGVREFFGPPDNEDGAVGMFVFFEILDLPCSAIADTFLLPYDLYVGDGGSSETQQ